MLTGDTKPLKDQIKKLGGKFGSRFDTSKVPSGIGWLFPKTKLAAVQNFVAQYGKSTQQEISPLLLNAIKLAALKNGGLPLSGNDFLTGWRDWDEYPRYLQSLPKTHIYTRKDDKYSSRVAILDTSDTPWFLDHPEKCEVTDGFYSWECDRNDLIPILLWQSIELAALKNE